MLDQFPSPPSVWLRRALPARTIDILEDGFVVDAQEGDQYGADATPQRVLDRKDWRCAGRSGYPAIAIAVGTVVEFKPGQISILDLTGWCGFVGFAYKEAGQGTLDDRLIRFFKRRQASLPVMTRSGLPWTLVLIEDPDARAVAIQTFLGHVR